MSSKSRVVLPALLLLSVLAAVAACSKSADQAAEAAGESASAPAAPPVQGQDNRAGSLLAYEHEVTIWSGGSAIRPVLS